MAYLDYSQLIQVINADWDLFSYAVLNKPSWEGRQEELKRIRHRIGHMRRPHPDDLGRLEQTLRDLEGGTFLALASYNRECYLTAKQYSDPVTKGWVARKHHTAMRLIAHAERQYDTNFELTYSLRPWAEPVDDAGPDGHLGAIWKAHFTIGGSRRLTSAVSGATSCRARPSRTCCTPSWTARGVLRARLRRSTEASPWPTRSGRSSTASSPMPGASTT